MRKEIILWLLLGFLAGAAAWSKCGEGVSAAWRSRCLPALERAVSAVESWFRGQPADSGTASGEKR